MFYPYSDDAHLWDPANASITALPRVGYNIFCTGHSMIADGRQLITGGHISNNHGLNDASYYDPFANTWTRLPDMNGGRWYPSSTTLANGDVLVTSGDNEQARNNDIAQVWQVTSGTWRSLTSARRTLPLYPRTFLAPNGRVFFATSLSVYLDTAGTGAWTDLGFTRFNGRDNYGSACIDHNGKVYWFGGGDPPTATCEMIDLNAATPTWNFIASMPQARRQNNATILPDGKFLVTGGSASPNFDTADGGKAALLYDPVANTWATMAAEQNYRGYHSCANLLPDGRVLSSGGDTSPNAQIFSPPYLFNGPRPAISSAPASVGYGTTFFVGTPDGASIAKVTWTRLGSTTHAQNWDQRINVLSFAQAAGGLNVTAPNNVNFCPPGFYLLWILNGSGVPSVSRIVRISDFAAPPPAPTGLSAAGGIAKVTLTWNSVGTATSYSVKRSTTSGGPYATIATGVQSASYTDSSVTGGTTYFYVVSAVNPQGESPNSNQASVTPAAPGTGTGLNGDYYNNMTLTAPITLTRTDATVNFDWGTGSPGAGIAVDAFSVRWTGQVELPFNQTYTFYTISDDGVRLWVNNVAVIDNWTDHGATEDSGSIALNAGRYDVRMEFYENGGDAIARLLWSSPAIAKEVVPQSQLYPNTAPPSVPAAPSNLTASPTGKRAVTVNWTDNSSNETLFKIERSTDGVNFVQIITVGANVTTYKNTGLTSGVTYYYRVRATNGAGDSAYSNIASARAR